MDVREMRNEALGKRVVKALESRNMEAYYVKTKEEAVKKALELIPKGSTINMGGSASVRECGLIDAVCSDDYVFYDRDKAATVEERHEIALKAGWQEGLLTIQVHDDGKGFSEESLRSATRPFYKENTENDHFGLGLSICNTLCQKQGGTLSLSNRNGACVEMQIQAEKLMPIDQS